MAAPVRSRVSPGGRVLVIYAAVLLVGAIALPWWRMECRAPQYGARVLFVDISPSTITGDVREMDLLGHYVGMRQLETIARLERILAPFGILGAALCALAALILPAGRLRQLAIAAVVAVPVVFVLDLWAWQRYSVSHLDPTASLNLIQNRVQARVVGEYAVAQFKVRATFQEGFWLATIAALNMLGFAMSERRQTSGPALGTLDRGTSSRAAVACLVAACIGASSTAHAADREVGAGEPYRTIGDAVAAAQPGDTIIVRAGVYRERVTVDRPLVIRGEPGAVVDAGGVGTVVTIVRGPTEIRNLTIRGSGVSLVEEDAGIKVLDAKDVVIEGNQVVDVLFGILVISSPASRVAGNRVIGKALPPPRRGDGIRLFNSGASTVEANAIEQTRDLAIWQSNDVSVRRNVVRRSRYGLHFMYCEDSVFEDNLFEDNQVGAAIMYSRRLVLRRNRFVGSRGVGAVGLLIKAGDDVIAQENWVVDNTRGIFLEETPQSLLASCAIRSNVVAGNDVAVSLQPSVRRAVFSENAFVANRVQVEIAGGAQQAISSWSERGRGNFWSDYHGFDADRDGVGDTPYRVEQFFENLTGERPELGLLRLGPAAEALELGARAFPIGRPRPAIVDEHPLITLPTSLPESSPQPSRPGFVLAGLATAGAALWLTWRVRRVPVLGGTQ